VAGEETRYFCCNYVGRRSGRHFDVPAGYHLIGGVVSVFTNSSWRHNFAGGRNIEVTLRGVRQPAQAALCDDPDEVAEIYQQLIEDLGTDRAARRLGLRFNVDRAPTRDELSMASDVRGCRLCGSTRTPGPCRTVVSGCDCEASATPW
jgi:hypothetical protein